MLKGQVFEPGGGSGEVWSNSLRGLALGISNRIGNRIRKKTSGNFDLSVIKIQE